MNDLKRENLEKDLKALELYIVQIKNNPNIRLSEIRQWEIKYRRTMIRYRTLVINNQEVA